jgi:NADPH:quinone reductase-like Zn-dependent oxidoreductase
VKAVTISGYGGPEMFEMREMPDPVAATGEVIIRVAAAGVNPVDALDRAGGTKEWRHLKFPAVIGWDVSGTIIFTGAGVENFAVGDRVMAWAFQTYAELVTVDAALLVKVPDDMDLVDAAALPLATMTGTQLISVASGMRPCQTILVSGALGSVGRAAVFTAKDKGAKVIVAVRAAQLVEARSLGADQIIALDDAAALNALAPVDIVANTVRGITADLLLGTVKRNGRFASVTGAPPAASGRPDVDVIAFVSKNDASSLLYTAAAWAAGKLQIPVGARFPLSQARHVHELLARGGAGKMLLIP